MVTAKAAIRLHPPTHKKMVFTVTRDVLSLLFVYFVMICLPRFIDGQSYMRCHYFVSPLYLKASDVTKKIQIPIVYGQDYLPDQNCEWDIRTENPNDVVRLHINKRRLEGADGQGECLRDYLEFFEVKSSGTQKYLGRYCGRDYVGTTLETSSSRLNIHFVSNTYFNYEGFVMTYSAQPRKPDSPEDKSDTALAVGISVGIISIIGAVIIVIYFYRRWFTPKNYLRDHGSLSHSSSQHNQNLNRPQNDNASNCHPSTNTTTLTSNRLSIPGNPYNEIPSNRSSLYDYNVTHSHSHENSENGGGDPQRHGDHVIDLRPRPNFQGRRSSSSSLSTFLPAADAPSTVNSTSDGVSGSNSGGGEDFGRNRTPPPSYEFTVMYDRLNRQEGAATIMPLQPPDYEFVVKENQLRNSVLDEHDA